MLTVTKNASPLFPPNALIAFLFLQQPYLSPTMQTQSLDSSRYSDVRSFNSSHFRSFASQQTDELADFVSLQDLFLSNKAIELMLDYIEHGIFPQDSGEFSLLAKASWCPNQLNYFLPFSSRFLP